MEWNETYRAQRSILLLSGTPKSIFVHVPLMNRNFGYEITAEAINIDSHDWVFSCKSQPETNKFWYVLIYVQNM